MVGLKGQIAALALHEVHVLFVERPGSALTRIAAERAIAERGWRVARSAADADALLCCGEPGPELDPLVDRLFAQLPRPRVREQADVPGEVAAALDRIVIALRSEDAASPITEGSPARADDAEQTADSADMDHGDMDQGDMDHGDMGHGDMDMDMSGPGGIELAGGDTDRDGLEMDVLSVRLGPALPAWPAGLVMSVTLAGDLVTSADVEVIGQNPGSTGFTAMSGREQAALIADRIGWLLLLAGAGRAEGRLRQVRDGLLDGADIAWCTGRLRRLTDRLSRSRSLRWSLRDLGRIDQGVLQEMDLPLHWAGDVLDRLHRRLTALSDLVQRIGDTADDAGDLIPPVSRAGLDLVADTARGLDLGTARLVIASVDIDLADGAVRRQPALTAGSGEAS